MTALVLAAFLAAGSAQSIDIDLGGVRFSNPALRIGQDYQLRQGETAREVVVIAGDAIIDGTVDRDVAVILGKVQVASTAVIHGSMVVVGGTAVIAEGAQVHEDLVVIGGFEGTPGFNPGGHQVVIGTAALGSQLRGIVPWLVHGLLLGRPIVPDLWWVWVVAGVFFVINLLLNLVFDSPIRASAATLRATPLSAFMTGLLVMLLSGPVCFLLAVSLIGIAVIPFLTCAILLAVVLGKIAFARWIGMSVMRQEDPEDRLASLRSFVIGSAVMCVAYMIPVLGFITWAMAGVFGLGAATLAFGAAYRRENPKKPKPPKAVPVAAPAPPVEPIAVAPPITRVDVSPEVAFANAAVPPAESAADYSAFPAAPAAVPVAGAVAAGGMLALPRAAFMERLAAFALDFILVVMIAQLLDLDRHVDAPLGRIGILMAIAYHVGFWTWKGTTLGGLICNLRVVRTDGGHLQFAEALVRGLTGLFSLAVAGIGFLWILRDPERQAWHDRVAGTYVVKVPRGAITA